MSATQQEQTVVRLVVDEAGQLVVPASIVAEAGLEPGESVEVELTLKGVLLVPIRTEAEIEEYWGPNWREEFERADADVAAGRTTFQVSDDEFLAALEARSRANPRGE